MGLNLNKNCEIEDNGKADNGCLYGELAEASNSIMLARDGQTMESFLIEAPYNKEKGHLESGGDNEIDAYLSII